MGTSKENFIILHDNSVSEILTKDPTDLLLHDAAFEGNIKLVGKYLAEGININAKNEVGNTALHYAAFNHKWKIVDFLVANGAKVNPRGSDGNTPLDGDQVAVQGIVPYNHYLIYKGGAKANVYDKN